MKTVKPGIRLKESGRYLATKSLGGKRHYQEFATLREAQKWKNEFHPLLSPSVNQGQIQAASDQSNGKDKSITFGQVLEKYKKGFLASLEAYTQYKKELRLSKFAAPILNVPMCLFNPEAISNLIAIHKENASERRCNFDKELKDLASVFNWYASTEFTFVCPVIKVHFKLGKIKDVAPKQRILTMDEFQSFVDHLEEPYQTLAITQFFMAGRIQEAAAINDRTVDLKRKKIFVTEKLVWMRGKPEHKFGTKTGEVGSVDITPDMEERLLQIKATRPKGCPYFFHKKGKLLRYNLIRAKYNQALIDAGLPHFTGTNILRHSMATLLRQLGGLGVAQKMLRHTTARMTEGYAKLDVDKDVSNVVLRASELFRVRATKCDQTALSS